MWTAASAVVFVPLIALIILACFASTRQVGKWKGWTKISVKLFGLGYTIERYNVDHLEDTSKFPPPELDGSKAESEVTVEPIEYASDERPDYSISVQWPMDRTPPIEGGDDLADKTNRT